MGLDDRDWYRKALREREKQRRIDETRSKFSAFSHKYLRSNTASPTKTGFIPMLVIWCAVMGILYVLMAHYLNPKQAQVIANGNLVINRSQDGHFYTTGKINGLDVKFLVDTGASLVSVSEKFAQKARIVGGVATTFQTANGEQPGRVVGNVGVSIGPITVNNVKVGVGLRMRDEDQALLGQSFLSKFDVKIGKDQMTLQPR